MDSPDTQLLAKLILDIKQDVGSIQKDLSETKEITIRNTVVLEEHARRSKASEDRLEVQEEKLDNFIEKMEPVQDHVKVVAALTKTFTTVVKVVGVVVSVISVILGILKLR
jgi:hypothetical protein